MAPSLPEPAWQAKQERLGASWGGPKNWHQLRDLPGPPQNKSTGLLCKSVKNFGVVLGQHSPP